MSSPELVWLASQGLGRPPRRAGAGGGAPGDFPLGRRVLIAEDNWLIATEWEAALREAGYLVTGVAVSAEEALAACEEEPPDFAIVDIRLLGEPDGVDLAVELRRRRQIPSVFVSAHDDPATRERAAGAEPLGWISKPVVAARLPQLLRQLGARRS